MFATCAVQGLARLEELVRKLMDIVDNRVQANLDTIRAMQLVELPADRWAKCRHCAAVFVYLGGLIPTGWPHTAQSGESDCQGPEAKPHQ